MAARTVPPDGLPHNAPFTAPAEHPTHLTALDLAPTIVYDLPLRLKHLPQTLLSRHNGVKYRNRVADISWPRSTHLSDAKRTGLPRRVPIVRPIRRSCKMKQEPNKPHAPDVLEAQTKGARQAHAFGR